MKERDELIEEARELLGWPDECAGNWPATMADFALQVLERSIYREICEAATIIELPHYTICRVQDGRYEVHGPRFRVWKRDTLAGAFEFVKGEKDGK